MRHEQLQSEEGEKLKESVPIKLVRPAPPPPPEGWLDRVREGAQLELFFLGGWWEVKLLKRLAAKGGKPARFKVVAEKYNAQHTVLAEALRPGWSWRAGAKTWKLRK